MTEPFHDGEDRLDQLYQMRALNQAQRLIIEELIAEEEGVPTEAVHRRRRETLRIVRWVPGTAGGLVLVRKLAGAATNPRVAASVLSAAAIAGGAIAFAVIKTPSHDHAGQAPTAAAPPPIRHNPPHAGPRKTGPPRKPTPAEPVDAPPITKPPVTVPTVSPSFPPASSTPAVPDVPTHGHKHKVKPEPVTKTRHLLKVKLSAKCQVAVAVLEVCLPVGQWPQT